MKKLLIVLLIISFLPYFIGIQNAQVKDKDEAIYAEVAREMVESGNYFDTTLNYRSWFQHPPFVMWLIALSYKIFGINSFAVHFPSLLFSLLTLFLAYSLGREFTSSEIGGFLSSLCLVSSPAYHLMVTDAKLDMVLLFFITLTFYSYVKSLKKESYLILFYLSMGLGFLTKGPIGIVFPLFPISIHWFIKRKEINLPKTSLIWGGFLILILIFPWYFYMYKAHGIFFLKRIIIEQNFKRFFTTNFTEKNTPFYYFHTLAWAFLPFLFPFFASIILPIKALKKHKTLSNGYIISLLWFFIPFIIMSFSHSKLPHYIFPILPPASILSSFYLLNIVKGEKSSSFVIFQFLIVLLILFFFLSLNFIFFPPISNSLFSIFLLIFFSGISFSLISLELKNIYFLISLTVISISIIHFSINFHIYPELLKYQPSKIFSIKIRKAPQRVIYTYKFSPKGSLNFYFKKKVVELNMKELRKLLEDKKEIIIIFPKEQIKTFKKRGYFIKLLSFRSYYPISRLSLKFLNLEERKKVCKDIVLAKISKIMR